MEIQELLPDLPYMSDDMRLDMHRKYCRQYLFYRKHGTYIDCFCTSCLKRYRLDLDKEAVTPHDAARLDAAYSIRHNAEVTCTECGASLCAKAEGIGRSKLREQHNLVCFYALDNKVYAVCGQLTSNYGEDGKDDIEWLSKYCNGSCWWVLSVVEYTPGASRQFKYYWGTYEQDSRMYEPYIMRSYGYDYFEAYNPEMLQNSFLRYVLPWKYTPDSTPRGQRYNGYKPLLYMMYAVRYPAVEMLIKSGMVGIIEDIVDRGQAHKSVVSLDGKNAAEVFRTDGNDASVIRQTAQSGTRVDIDTLQCWRRLKSIGKRQGRRYKFADAVMICDTERYDYSIVLDMLKKTALTPQKLVNYLVKQSRTRAESQLLLRGTLQCVILDYRDYIGECCKLGYDVTDDQICRPHDLLKVHKRTSEALNAIERERLEKEAAEKTANYQSSVYKGYVEQYEYEDSRYCIIVPKSVAEIVEEGKNQHHCVAGYADRHISGKLAILFMRDIRSRDTALYTIEMHGDRLIQIRGKGNCDPTPKAQKFVDKWLKWVALPNGKKHPKSKNTKTA